MKKTRIEVLSPDGITIDFDKASYPSQKAADSAFEKWKKRFEGQGYYSSRGNRIPLDQLRKHCSFNPVS